MWFYRLKIQMHVHEWLVFNQTGSCFKYPVYDEEIYTWFTWTVLLPHFWCCLRRIRFSPPWLFNRSSRFPFSINFLIAIITIILQFQISTDMILAWWNEYWTVFPSKAHHRHSTHITKAFKVKLQLGSGTQAKIIWTRKPFSWRLTAC